MEIILREHVEHLGNRGDIVSVADGYARNYLLPRQLALPATAGNRKRVERERKLAEAREADERRAAEAVAERLAGVEVVVARRVGENDTLYGSVTSADVAASLAAQHVDIDRRKIQLPEPLKALGEYDVPVRLHREVTGQVKVKVVKLED
jgi:large subunit ribosomal protein L9